MEGGTGAPVDGAPAPEVPEAAESPRSAGDGGAPAGSLPKRKLSLKQRVAQRCAVRVAAEAAAALANKKRKKLAEPLLELGPHEKCAIALNEAINSRCYLQFPPHRLAWDSYVAFHRCDGWLQYAVLGLLTLSLFETPLWCNRSGEWYWKFEAAEDRCSAAGGIPKEEIIMSGVTYLPTGIGAIVEYTLLIAMLVRVTLIFRVEYAFKDCGSLVSRTEVLVSIVLVMVGLLDATYYWRRPGTLFRLAPFVRFGLAATIPWMRDILFSFWRVLVAISKVFSFLAVTCVIFAWVAAMILDDLDAKDRYGDPVNQGFGSFGEALYTSFATMTTAITPDVMIPTYVYSRGFVFMWLPFLVLATVIFTNLLLATVYSDYQQQTTASVMAGIQRRKFALQSAFEMVKEASLENPAARFSVRFDSFQRVANMLLSFRSLTADERILRLVYEAGDTNHDGRLTEEEFLSMCDVLETDFLVTRRDSWFRIHFGDTGAGRLLKSLVEKNAEGPDYGYNYRFQGSKFDGFMNFVLLTNVIWVVLQSAVDLNDMREPSFFMTIDLFFSLVYLLEVGFKLGHWSWGEYWQNTDNRFDFLTTMILAGSAMGYLFFKVDRSILRYLNLLRLVRILKALNNVAAVREVWSVINRVVRSCSGVLAMNFLVIYLWSAAGVQFFGGSLVDSNPRLKDKGLAYFASHYQVYNFNDMFMGMVTLYYFTLGTWIDPLAGVCSELADRYTPAWFGIWAFLLSFYVASPLLAFNVFTSFSIDVFCNLQDMDQAGQDSKASTNLKTVKDQLASEGLILHIQESAELSRYRVFTKMFAT